MKYSRAVYEDMFGSDSGTMIIIDMDEREISIYSDGAVHPTATIGVGVGIETGIETTAGAVTPTSRNNFIL